jgi:hypothetical protein
MKHRKSVPGHGFSLEGRQAARARLEGQLPDRGPECPLTFELIELAQDLKSAPEKEFLEKHLAGCAYCRQRLEAQQRVRQRLEELYQAGAPLPGLADDVAYWRQRRHPWVDLGSARPWPVQYLSADGGDDDLERIDQVATLPWREGPTPLLNFGLQWSRLGFSPWSLTLRLPRHGRDHEHGNSRAALDQLEGYQVRLRWRTADGASGEVQTQLDRSSLHDELVSTEPITVPGADPETVQEVELALGQRMQGLDGT